VSCRGSWGTPVTARGDGFG